MEKLDIAMLRALRDWRAQGRVAMLAPVVRTWGASPRPVGSMMALREDRRSVSACPAAARWSGCWSSILMLLRWMRCG